jgi:hypothetical protein
VRRKRQGHVVRQCGVGMRGVGSHGAGQVARGRMSDVGGASTTRAGSVGWTRRIRLVGWTIKSR